MSICSLAQCLWVRNSEATPLGSSGSELLTRLRSGCWPWLHHLKAGVGWKIRCQGGFPSHPCPVSLGGPQEVCFLPRGSPYRVATMTMALWHGSWLCPRAGDPRGSKWMEATTAFMSSFRSHTLTFPQYLPTTQSALIKWTWEGKHIRT